MPMKIINLGNYANDGTGDDLRRAFEKVNDNFAVLGATVGITTGANLGTGTSIFAQRNATLPTLEFKTLTSTDNSVELTYTDTTVNLKNKSILLNDPIPKLGANLDLDTHYIYHGDVQTTVFGLDLRATNSLLELLITSNSMVIDFGTFLNPASTTFDLDMNGLSLNGFVGTPATNQIDLGSIVVI
jgi:hypothetical protein